jgi:hypothetical protein
MIFRVGLNQRWIVGLFCGMWIWHVVLLLTRYRAVDQSAIMALLPDRKHPPGPGLRRMRNGACCGNRPLTVPAGGIIRQPGPQADLTS